jgi:hypothetical protein
MTGLDIVLTEDSIISAPYLTTLELAFPCSYARKAVCTSGIWDTLDTKSGELISSGGGEGNEVDRDEDEALERAGVG